MELNLEKLNLPNRHYVRGLLLLVFSLLLISFSPVSPAGYALSLPATAGFNPAVQVPLQNANTTTTSSATTTTGTASNSTTNNSSIAPAQSQPPFANWPAWHAYISNNTPPQAGCFVATYPNLVWQPVQCVTPPKGTHVPSPTPTTPSIVGNSNDWVAQSPGAVLGSPYSNVILRSTGSFQSISGLTSEKDVCFGPSSPPPPPPGSFCGTVKGVNQGAGPNYYTLQDNTNHFTTTTTYTGNKPATVWAQFLFDSNGGTAGEVESQSQTAPATTSGGVVYIEYWLMGYQSTYCPGALKTPPTAKSCCPTLPLPDGSTWGAAGGSCVDNTMGTPTPSEPATSLSSLTLEANSYNGNFGAGEDDQSILCVTGGRCYMNSITSTVLNLYENWSGAEFNVVGYCCGSRAVFNSGTTITVVNSLLDQDEKGIKPSCTNTFSGFTGETNNLNLGSCSVSGNSIVFTESNALEPLTTGIQSGWGSVSPNCPKGCSEEFASEVTVTANPSPGWVFSVWSIQTGGISCSTNPCTFAMPLNSVTLEAAFVPVMTVSYKILGGGTPTPPSFNYVQGGVSKSLVLTTTPVQVLGDIGSSWSVPNSLSEEVCIQTTVTFCHTVEGEIWVTTQATSGKFTLAGGSTIVFKYQNQYYLTMQVNPAGTAVTSPGGIMWYDAGQRVPIWVNEAKAGYKFLSWTGSGAGSYSGTCKVAGCSSSATVTMNAPITETANFGVIIQVISNPTGAAGAGYVTVDGAAVKTPWTTTWVVGSTHTIAALSPVSCGTGCRYNFTSWSDGGAQSHTITVPGSPTTYIVYFQQGFLLTTAVNPSGGGSVIVFTPSSSTGWYNAGQKVILTEIPHPGYKFVSWTGKGTGSYTGTGNIDSATITMNGPITETANFEQT